MSISQHHDPTKTRVFCVMVDKGPDKVPAEHRYRVTLDTTNDDLSIEGYPACAFGVSPKDALNNMALKLKAEGISGKLRTRK